MNIPTVNEYSQQSSDQCPSSHTHSQPMAVYNYYAGHVLYQIEHTKCVCRPSSTCRDHQWLSLTLLVGVVSKLHFVSNNGTLPFYKQLYKIFIFKKKISKTILSRKNLAFIFENGACVIKKQIIWSALNGYIQQHARLDQFLCIVMLRNSARVSSNFYYILKTFL